MACSAGRACNGAGGADSDTQRADPVDFDGDPVAVRERSDTGGRTGGNHVARQKGHHRGCVADQPSSSGFWAV